MLEQAAKKAVLALETGEGLYYNQSNPQSPFVKRGQPPISKQANLGPNSLGSDQTGYNLWPNNRQASFAKRGLAAPTKAKPGIEPQIKTPQKLLGNPSVLEAYLKRVIYESLSMMVAKPPNPQGVRELVREMEQICRDEGVDIPHIRAFNGLDRLEQFQQLLVGLFEGDSPYRFELTAAAFKEMLRLLETK